MKIKITPIKSQTLCKKCKFDTNRHCINFDFCKGCERILPMNKGYCKCLSLEMGEPCPDFVRAEGVGGAADEQ